MTGSNVIDNAKITGSCVILFLWARGDEGPAWQKVAVGNTLVDANTRNAAGREVICMLEGLPGPHTYQIPLGDLPKGWYTACDLTDLCTAPFEKT
ncbi:MAG: hypothetical protein WCE80_09875 [Acidimicrobiia bacterium]